MTNQGEFLNSVYIGDGVYLRYDDFGYWLYANHHEFPTDKVYMEDTVILELIRVIKATDERLFKAIMGL